MNIVNFKAILLFTANSFIYYPSDENTFIFDETSIVRVEKYETKIEACVYNVYNMDKRIKTFNMSKSKNQDFEYIFPYKNTAIFVMKSRSDNATLFYIDKSSLFTYLNYSKIRYDNSKKQLYLYNDFEVKVYAIENFLKSLPLELPLKPEKVFKPVQKWEDFQFFNNFILFKHKNMTL